MLSVFWVSFQIATCHHTPRPEILSAKVTTAPTSHSLQRSQEHGTTRGRDVKIQAPFPSPCSRLKSVLFPGLVVSSELFITAKNCQDRSTREEERETQQQKLGSTGRICLKTFVKHVCSALRQWGKPCSCQKNLSQQDVK